MSRYNPTEKQFQEYYERHISSDIYNDSNIVQAAANRYKELETLYNQLITDYKELEKKWGTSLVCEGCGKEGKPVSYNNGSYGCVLCDHCSTHLEW